MKRTLATCIALLVLPATAHAQDAPGQCVPTQKALKSYTQRHGAQFCTAQGSRTARVWHVNCLMKNGSITTHRVINQCPVPHVKP